MPVKIKKSRVFNKNKKNISENDEKRDSKIVLLLLIIFIILLGMLIGMSFSKYQSKLEGQAIANIAKPVIEVRKEQSLLLTVLAPKASYVFEVRNFKEDELNEIEMEYYIEIVSHTDEAISFALYRGEEQISLTNNKTEKIKITKEEKQTHSYCLEITYDKTKGEIGKDINENVEVKIHSIQTA